MPYGSIVAWIVGICTGIRRSQAKTLGELVLGAMRCRRASLADIGRSMCGNALAKHRIKRVDRFVGNERVEVAEAFAALVHLACKAAGGMLVIAVDWVDVRQYKVLCAAVPLRGRSVPILLGGYQKGKVWKSQNAFEEGFFLTLRALLPQGSEAVIIADRGFHRAELARVLQDMELSYVIRVPAKVSFATLDRSVRLDEVRPRPGKHIDLGWGAYRKTKPVRQRVVVFWKKSEKDQWFLVTNLEWGWRKVVVAYALRMKIEELFRDEKNIRYGWGLRQLALGTCERLERMLLVLAFAYLVLLLIGVLGEQTLSSAWWASGTSTKRPQASVFFIGRQLCRDVGVRLRWSRILLVLPSVLATLDTENWG